MTLSFWKLKATAYEIVCNKVKKKRGHAHSLDTFHTRIPTRPSGICYEPNFHIWLKGQKFEQEASKQSSKNSVTQWYIVVFGGRCCCSTWDLQQCPFCLTRYTFLLKSETWDVRVCQMWNWMRDFFHSGGRNKTLHSASCSVPARHCEIYIFSSLTFFCYSKVMKTTCVPTLPLHVQY